MSNKEQLEKEHSSKMNEDAIKRIQEEAQKEEPTVNVSEEVFFEDTHPVRLRDGKTYQIPPLTLKNARMLMQKLRTVNVDVIILNFLPTGDVVKDAERENDLYDILEMAFVNYPEVDRDYIDAYMDLEQARETIDVLIGLNQLKK
ncbi:hypothetical protein ACPA0F_18230 [Solibacillus silvestris]